METKMLKDFAFIASPVIEEGARPIDFKLWMGISSDNNI